MNYTPAMEITHLIAESGISRSSMQVLLGCSESAMKSWFRQARADAEGTDPPPNARQPADHWRRHVRALVMIHAAAPGMLAHLKWEFDDFAAGMWQLPKWPLARAKDWRVFRQIIDGDGGGADADSKT